MRRPDFERPIKTIPAAIARRGCSMVGEIGRLYRGANGVYLCELRERHNNKPTLRGFKDEQDLIGFINANLPWEVWN